MEPLIHQIFPTLPEYTSQQLKIGVTVVNQLLLVTNIKRMRHLNREAEHLLGFTGRNSTDFIVLNYLPVLPNTPVVSAQNV